METKGERAASPKLRVITAGSEYAYNSSFKQAVEKPVQASAVKVGKSGSLGFLALFAKANKKIWIDLDDLRARISDELFSQVYNSENVLTLNCNIGFSNGVPVVAAA